MIDSLQQRMMDAEAKIGADVNPHILALAEALQPYSPSVAGYRDGNDIMTIHDPEKARAAFIYEMGYHDMVKTTANARNLLKGNKPYGYLDAPSRLEMAVQTLDTASKGAFTAAQMGVADDTQLGGAIEGLRDAMKRAVNTLQSIELPEHGQGAQR
jgi:hypothetical protein